MNFKDSSEVESQIEGELRYARAEKLENTLSTNTVVFNQLGEF